MDMTVKYRPRQRINQWDRKPSWEKEGPNNPLVAEGTAEDPEDALENLDDILEGPTVSLVPSPDVTSDELTGPRLPSVDEFDFDAACAKRMARKFAPRIRNRNLGRDQWIFPGGQNERDDAREARGPNSRQQVGAPSGGGHGFLWGFCTSILLVLGTPAAFGFVQPLNDLLPERVGGFLAGISGELGASLVDRAEPSAGVEVAAGNSNSDTSGAIPAQPVAVPIGGSGSTAPATSAVQLSTASVGYGLAEKAEPPAEPSEQALEAGATVLAPGTVGQAETEIATVRSAAVHAGASQGAEIDQSRVEASQKPEETSPLQVASTQPAAAVGRDSSLMQGVASPLSAANVGPGLDVGHGFVGQAEAPAAPSVQAPEAGATIVAPDAVEQAETPAAPSVQAPEADATIAAPGAVGPAATEIATARSAAAPARDPYSGTKDQSRVGASRQLEETNPLQVANTQPATAVGPESSAVQRVGSPLSAAQINRLLARGEELLQSGDIASARLLFLRIAAAGDRRGAKGMGMTYDPRVYARLPVTGLTPDPEQAEIWYRKAGENPTLSPGRNAISVTSQAQADTAEAQSGAFPALQPGSPEWNAECARKYKSFDPSTGLYTALSGAKRQCNLQ